MRSERHIVWETQILSMSDSSKRKRERLSEEKREKSREIFSTN